MKNTVYVVHCVDTEGPLYEEKSVPFELIKNIFGIEIEQSEENLKKLQKGEIDLRGKESAVMELLDPHRTAMRGSWKEIDEMLDVVTSEKFRNQYPDSKGNGWIFNWFCMAHEGFTGSNPRRRVTGFNTVRDHYCELIEKQQSKDLIGFHYHPIPFSGNYNESGTAYWATDNVAQILCHGIIDRGWFPAVFRPGFHTERPDSNWFLEQWIPFDYANQSVKCTEEKQLDLAEGRFGDWRHAPLEWRPYHPDHDDYQKKGMCRRYITRCLNMYARIRQLSQEDVNDAFEDAEKYGSSILAFTDHDYKDMEFEIDRVRNLIKNAAEHYPNVEFVYSDAIEAMQKCLNLDSEEVSILAEIKKDNSRIYLDVKVDRPIFGPQPFLAIKTKDGRYFWDNFDFYKYGEEWTYTFDNNTVKYEDVDVIGVAANSANGDTQVILLRQ